MKLSIVIPVYNEGVFIERTVELAVAQPVDGVAEREIIIVDDASTDGTPQIAKNLAEKHFPVVRVLRHDRNCGKGAALRTGFKEAVGDIILVQDGDFEYHPRDYGRLLRPIVNGQADVVYGSRFMGSSEKRVIFFWHMMGNRLLTLWSNMLTNLNLTDMETGYKVFRKEVVDALEIKEERFGVEPEITAKVASLGARIYEVGIGYHGRTYDEGKKIGWKDGVRALWVISKYFFKCRILRSDPLKINGGKSTAADSGIFCASTMETRDAR